jgi:hypothetical protein
VHGSGEVGLVRGPAGRDRFLCVNQVGKVKMIRGIEGLPGSGKSYYAVEHIYSSLKSGKTVYTNMRNLFVHKIAWSIHRATGIDRKRILEKIKYIDTWDMENIWNMNIRNAEIVLDEVMVHWLSRDWSKMNRNTIQFFSQHRKFRVNFTYIAQSIDRVDSTLRDMTQTFISFRNTAFWKFGFIKMPQIFLAIHFAEDRKNILKREWIIPIKKYYDFYDSWALFPTKEQMLSDQGKGEVIPFPKIEGVEK